MGVLGGRDSGLEILLVEGGDVELGARISKHIFVFAFDPLTLNSLSLFVLCIASFSAYLSFIACVVPCIISYCLSSLYAWLVFVCLTCT